MDNAPTDFTKDARDTAHGWTAGAILTATTEGGKLIPGWLKHPFGIDAPLLHGETVWVIHHLPTGYVVAAIDGVVADAVKAVDVLLGLGDWEFTNPDGAKQYSGALKALGEAGLPVISASGVKRLDGPDTVKIGGAA